MWKSNNLQREVGSLQQYCISLCIWAQHLFKDKGNHQMDKTLSRPIQGHDRLPATNHAAINLEIEFAATKQHLAMYKDQWGLASQDLQTRYLNNLGLSDRSDFRTLSTHYQKSISAPSTARISYSQIKPNRHQHILNIHYKQIETKSPHALVSHSAS